MFEVVLPYVASPWIYALVVAITIDGVIPALPIETRLIVLGALAANGHGHASHMREAAQFNGRLNLARLR